MPRTRSTAMHVQAFRLPADLVKRLDRYAAQLRREQPGRTATRADALRVLLERALSDVEKEDRHGAA